MRRSLWHCGSGLCCWPWCPAWPCCGGCYCWDCLPVLLHIAGASYRCGRRGLSVCLWHWTLHTCPLWYRDWTAATGCSYSCWEQIWGPRYTGSSWSSLCRLWSKPSNLMSGLYGIAKLNNMLFQIFFSPSEPFHFRERDLDRSPDHWKHWLCSQHSGIQEMSFDGAFYCCVLSICMLQHSCVVYCPLLHDILIK